MIVSFHHERTVLVELDGDLNWDMVSEQSASDVAGVLAHRQGLLSTRLCTICCDYLAVIASVIL
jgi:hypothetical protein